MLWEQAELGFGFNPKFGFSHVQWGSAAESPCTPPAQAEMALNLEQDSSEVLNEMIETVRKVGRDAAARCGCSLARLVSAAWRGAGRASCSS